MSIQDARELHRVNYELVKPLSRRLDVAVGPSSEWAWDAEFDRQVEYENTRGRDMDQDQARLEFELATTARSGYTWNIPNWPYSIIGSIASYFTTPSAGLMTPPLSQ